MTLGRTKGDFIFEDASLSNTHCEFIPRGLTFFVVDLNSTNGVFVNKTKIFPGMETKLDNGDKIRIGHQEFSFYDNEDQAKTLHHPVKVSGNNVFAHILTFFGAPKEWTIFYTVLILGTVGSFIVHMRLDSQVPKHLEFLKVFYNDHIMPEGIKMVALILVLCLAHSAIIVYALRTKYTKFLSGMIFFAVVIYFIPMIHGPLWYVNNYVSKREYTQLTHLEIATINHLKNLIDAEGEMARCVGKIESMLPAEEKQILVSDYEKVRKQVLDQEKRIRMNGN